MKRSLVLKPILFLFLAGILNFIFIHLNLIGIDMQVTQCGSTGPYGLPLSYGMLPIPDEICFGNPYSASKFYITFGSALFNILFWTVVLIVIDSVVRSLRKKKLR